MSWILIAVIAALIIALGIVFIFKTKGKKRKKADYKTFLYMGIVWIAIGGAFMFMYEFEFNTLFSLGVIFLVIGAAGMLRKN